MSKLESILERVQKDIGNLKCKPGPKRLCPDILQAYFVAGHLTILQRAVEMLSRKSQILTFMDEFTAYLGSKAGLAPDQARERANCLAGYATGYVGDRRANIWFDALPDISHPVTGRERPFRKDVIDAGYIVHVNANCGNEVIEDLNGIIQASKLELVSQSDKGISVAIMPAGTPSPQSNHSYYLLLKGFCMGYESRLRSELGKHIEVKLEAIPSNRS